jgi:hypothetical protein
MLMKTPGQRGCQRKTSHRSHLGKTTGKLRIGDNWNAITIIALSQNNPLKAIAEFVENSIDAQAKNITIVRGREKGEPYLKVIDDGNGIPLDKEGNPNFKYVATHICDSLKRRLKERGVEGIQGEYGIGLLSFWTVGDKLILSSSGKDGRVDQMVMQKNEPGYTIVHRKMLFSHSGTELIIQPLLPGLRKLKGERIQGYLASELRDRIRKAGVRLTIKDRQSRKELDVQPRQYAGRLLHNLGTVDTDRGQIYLELYVAAFSQENKIGLFRSGTRVVPSVTEYEFFDREPWSSGYLQGMIDVPFLQLTPGTRGGVVQDEGFHLFCEAMKEVRHQIQAAVDHEKKVEEEQASRNILKSVQRALREAFLALPSEEYDWFNIQAVKRSVGSRMGGALFLKQENEQSSTGPLPISETFGENEAFEEEREFYEHAGPLYKAIISPSSSVVKVNESKVLRCIARDRGKRIVERDIEFQWRIKEGEGALDKNNGEIITFTAPAEPGLTVVEVTAIQENITCKADSLITVAESLIKRESQSGADRGKGLPGYTFLREPGELWRSRYDEKRNLIVINNGHRDYVFSSEKKARKLKYICRLFAKELVLKNFPGYRSDEILERMIELSLYTEEYLK